MGDQYKDSQQDPESDSALQTPQPDQPHPPVFDRDQGANDSPPVHVDNPAAPSTLGEDVVNSD